MSTTEATIVIKGRNELTSAVKQAEQQLKGLARQGELLGKVLRGGAIVGAALAFEQLAQNAQKAAEAVGDKGTADALRKLNREIDILKAKGTNLVGKVLGNVYSAFSSDKVLQLREQVDFLRRMQGRSFVAVGYDDIGTGFFTAAEGAAKLLELEKKLALFESSRPYGSRTRAPGGQGGRGRSVFTDFVAADAVPKASRGGAADGPQFSAEFQSYLDNLDLQARAYEGITATARAAGETLDEYFNASIEQGLDSLTLMPSVVQTATNEMTVFAEQAGRNLQDAFAQFLFDPFKDGLRGMLQGFVDTIRQMVAQAMAAEILRAFFSWAGGAVGGRAGSFLSSLAPRAMGGPVTGGTPYLVGERGPEMFVPSSSGSIVPNHNMGGGISLTYNIDASGADAERIMAIIPGLLKQSEQRTVAEVRNLLNRGRM